MKKHRQKGKKGNFFKDKFKRFKRRQDKEKFKREREYSNVLIKMIDMYDPQEEDWMGFKLAINNTYTFHHIRERRNGGKEVVQNGAILTHFGHQFLNHLDSHNKRAYNDYQEIFKRINKSQGPIDDDLREDIYGMMLDVFYYNIYGISKDVLSFYEPFIRARAKTKVKKL
ncbi:MAG: hypothetical protein J6X02_02890 [Bacilli bacterium]|nr:hypothetical protein [Bacilli bacterium]